MAWRRDGRPNHAKGTKTKPGVFATVTLMIDGFIAEDRDMRAKAGRTE